MAAERGGQEKTEQPTSKRRKDARKEGNVFQSKDIVTVVMLAGIFLMMRLMMPYIYTNLRNYMKWIIEGINVDSFLSFQLFSTTVRVMLQSVLPLLLAAMMLGILSHGVQTRFNISFYPLKPKFSKLNPLKGIKNMFS